MSYESEVLADNPVLYWRMDMVGAASDGDQIPDISGNNLHGTLQFGAGSTEPYGYASPIETDPPSRAFRHYSAGDLVHGASITLASDPLIEFTGDFAMEDWVAPENVAERLVQKLKVFDGFCYGVQINPNGTMTGYIFDSAGTQWAVNLPPGLGDPVPAGGTQDEFVQGSFFHVVLTRLGNALAMYLNGVLRGITTITSGLPNRNEPGALTISAGVSGPSACRHDEFALYDHALSGPRVLAHYEAAFNALNMRGQADIRTSAIISVRDEPEPVAYPFRHNWDKPVIERFKWKSSVFKPVDGATELRRQSIVPRRQIEYQHLLYNEELDRRFMARAFAGRKALVQFEPDKVRVGNLAMGATSAAFDTTYLDYEVGQYVLVYQDDDLWEHQLITAVSATGIEFDALSRAYTTPWLKPARVARLPQSQQMVGETDNIGDASVQYDLLEEDEPISPNRIIPYSPTLTYRGRDCWDLREWQGHDYSNLPQHEWVADRSVLDEGTGVVATKTYRWGAEQLQPWNMNLQYRSMIAKYLGWLYERAGQANPFWMPTFRQDLKPLGRQGTQLMVSGHEYTDLYAPASNRVDLAFIYFDNTMILRRVESSDPGAGVDLLYLDATVPTFTNLRWLSFLRRVILSSDDAEIAWETDNVVRVAFAVTDAPLDWEAGSPSPSPSPSQSVSHSLSPSSSPSASASPSYSVSPSGSESPSQSPSASQSPSGSQSPSPSASSSVSPSASISPSGSMSPSISPSASTSPSSSASPSAPSIPTWAGITGATESPTGVLTKTASTNWGNCGAVSVEHFAGDCRFSYAWDLSAARLCLIGIGLDTSCNTYSTIDLGGLLRTNPDVEAYENGSFFLGTAIPGSDTHMLVEVERVGSTLKIYVHPYSGSVPAPGDPGRTLFKTAVGTYSGDCYINVAMFTNGTVLDAALMTWEAI